MRSDFRVFDALQTLRNRYMLCQLAPRPRESSIGPHQNPGNDEWCPGPHRWQGAAGSSVRAGEFC